MIDVQPISELPLAGSYSSRMSGCTQKSFQSKLRAHKCLKPLIDQYSWVPKAVSTREPFALACSTSLSCISIALVTACRKYDVSQKALSCCKMGESTTELLPTRLTPFCWVLGVLQLEVARPAWSMPAKGARLNMAVNVHVRYITVRWIHHGSVSLHTYLEFTVQVILPNSIAFTGSWSRH